MGRDLYQGELELLGIRDVVRAQFGQYMRCRKYMGLLYKEGFVRGGSLVGIYRMADGAIYGAGGGFWPDMVREAGPGEDEDENEGEDEVGDEVNSQINSQVNGQINGEDEGEGVVEGWANGPCPYAQDVAKKVAKRKAKDFVFGDLFGKKKYMLQLYQALHPEGHVVTEKMLHTVTIKNILLDQMYNDLGFMVGNQLIVLAEAQSTWSMNIIVRSLMYLVQSWHEYIVSTGQDLHKSKKVKLPRPEIYIIYTGKRKQRQEWASLSEEFFGGVAGAVEVKVKILYGGKDGDIISQYVAFTNIFNAQVKKYGQTREAVLETVRICTDTDVLKEYLEERKKEVVGIMMALFDEEYLVLNYLRSKEKEFDRKYKRKYKKEAEKEVKEAREEAREEARKEVREEARKEVDEARKAIKEAAISMLSDGMSKEKVAKYMGLTLEAVEGLCMGV